MSEDKKIYDWANPEEAARVLAEVKEEATRAEQERVLDLIDSEIEDWQQFPETINEIIALRMLRTRITRG